MSVTKRILCICIFIISCNIAESQLFPLNTVSYKFFNPFILNPAITGSKDYSHVNLVASVHKNTTAQILSGDTRLSKTVPGYFTAQEMKEFLNLGIGGVIFNDVNINSRNIGMSLANAYHMPLSNKSLSFLSFGAAYKGVYNSPKQSTTADTLTTEPIENIFYHNLDLGIYYYGERFYAGLSTTNLLKSQEDPENLSRLGIPVSQHYYFLSGYKFLLSKSWNIVLEPSITMASMDPSFSSITDHIYPTVKLYLMDFCLGYYYHEKSSHSFFFQYRYPRFFLGAFFEIPKKSAYYLKEPIIEISAGINLSRHKYRVIDYSRW